MCMGAQENVQRRFLEEEVYQNEETIFSFCTPESVR